MRTHIKSEIGVADDGFAISIGLAGLYEGVRREMILQAAKEEPDDQDIRLGLVGLYAEYDGVGAYGVVEKIFVENSRVRIILDPAKISAERYSIEAEIAFEFLDALNSEILVTFAGMCSTCGVTFKRS
ncbi:hypothetical protein KX729_20935 [Rhizobium sp. XQZ8]|uniref:hypothetical protein n=1 Tax=Rhizobium populisoli TaxID=2859785 RepID=UPI001CA5CB47|nr:hypothetical protein [Rhizobium populisoli]MBW6423931.1 hypothetical protein [Rhizobium populisoli]